VGNIFKKVLENNGLQIVLICGGLAVTLVNMYVATRLAPLEQNLTEVTRKADALTTQVSADEKYFPQFVAVEQTTTDINVRLTEIQSELSSIESYLRK
jgi:hypothetical protein